MATYAIGDVQGCFATLEALLARVGFAPGTDRVILVGDAVNRGPSSAAVLGWAMEQGEGVRLLLGNHELHLIARHLGAAASKGRDTLDELFALPAIDGVVDWLRACPFALREGRWLLVHAGVLPAWSVDDVLRLGGEAGAGLRGPHARDLIASLGDRPGLAWSDDLSGTERWRAIVQALTHLRCCDAAGRPVLDFKKAPAAAPPGCVPWFERPGPWAEEATAVFGHWAALGLHVDEHAICLDSGAAWGGSLTALRLEDGAIFQQPVVDRFAIPVRANR